MNKVFLLTILALSVSVGYSKISQWGIGDFIGQKNYHCEFMAPTIPGDYPVMVYSTGFGSLTPSQMYEDELTRIVEQGVVVIGLFQISLNFNYTTKAINLEQTLDWIKENIEDQMNSNAVDGVVANYNEKLILGCQSAGCHITSGYLNKTCGDVKAHIMQDPVDGSDPFGIIKDFVIIPGRPAPWKIPTLVEATGHDYDHNSLMPACAPKAHSCEVFYNAFDGPSWYANFTNYGHADCMGSGWATAARIMCPGCKSNCELNAYHQDLGNMFGSFIDALFNKNTTAWEVVENLEGITQKVDNRWKYNGYDKNTMGAFCIHDNDIQNFLE